MPASQRSCTACLGKQPDCLELLSVQLTFVVHSLEHSPTSCVSVFCFGFFMTAFLLLAPFACFPRALRAADTPGSAALGSISFIRTMRMHSGSYRLRMSAGMCARTEVQQRQVSDWVQQYKSTVGLIVVQ